MQKLPKYKLPIPTEDDEQEALYRWVSYMLPQYPELENFYHITNEGKRSVYEGARLNRSGLIKGMPDLCLPVPHGEYSAVYIELKRRKNGKVEKEQSERLMKLQKLGNCTAVCYGWEEAKEVLERYIKLPSEVAEKYKAWIKTQK